MRQLAIRPMGPIGQNALPETSELRKCHEPSPPVPASLAPCPPTCAPPRRAGCRPATSTIWAIVHRLSVVAVMMALRSGPSRGRN